MNLFRNSCVLFISCFINLSVKLLANLFPSVSLQPPQSKKGLFDTNIKEIIKNSVTKLWNTLHKVLVLSFNVGAKISISEAGRRALGLGQFET